MPAIVVIVVVGARCAHGLIRPAIEIDVVGRSAVLDCEERTVCAPRLIVGIVVPRVRPPGPARTRREIDRSSRIARNTEYLEPKRGRENRRKVSRLRQRVFEKDRLRIRERMSCLVRNEQHATRQSAPDRRTHHARPSGSCRYPNQ